MKNCLVLTVIKHAPGTLPKSTFLLVRDGADPNVMDTNGTAYGPSFVHPFAFVTLLTDADVNSDQQEQKRKGKEIESEG